MCEPKRIGGRLGSCPSRRTDHVSSDVDADVEPSLLHGRDGIGSSLTIGFAVGDSADTVLGGPAEA